MVFGGIDPQLLRFWLFIESLKKHEPKTLKQISFVEFFKAFSRVLCRYAYKNIDITIVNSTWNTLIPVMGGLVNALQSL